MPNSNARRQDVAAAIMKLARKPLEEYPEVDCASMFSDFNQVEDYNKEYIELAVKYGLLKGYDNGTLNPNGTVSRAEAVIMLQRGLALDGSNLSTFAYTGKWVSGATGDETYVEMTINSTHFGNPIKMAIQCSDVTINASGTLWNGQVAFSGYDSHNNFVVGYINFRNTDGYGYPVEADFSLYTLRKGGKGSSYSFEDMYLVDEDLVFDC
jgi:hypothetical protein